MDPKTRENLLTAMHGEAFAYAKYMLFANRARENGREDLATLFEKTATVELSEHFAEEAELVGLVGSDAENLQDAIKGESYEVETMYKDFAQQARGANEKGAGDRFAEVRTDEMQHRDAFTAVLKNLAAIRKS